MVSKQEQFNRGLIIALFLSSIVGLLLEILGQFICLVFASSPTDLHYTYVSYISLTTLGHGNIFPFAVVIASLSLSVILLVELLAKRNLFRARCIACICILALNAIPYAIGFLRLTIGAVIIEVLYALLLVLQCIIERKAK